MEKVQCYFLDRDDTILFVRDDAITFEVEEADLELSCSFHIDTEKPISHGMKIGFYDIDEKLVFYEIRTVEEDSISATAYIYAEHALIPEMLEDPLTDIRVANATAAQALEAILSGTRWQVRNSIETAQASARFWYINRWEAIKQIRDNWQIALDFSWAIDDTGIVSRYVDIISAEPVNRGKRFDTLKDISALRVSYDDTETCTALYGRGADEKTEEKDQDEQGNTYDHKISFASVVWSKSNGDPADKPSGQQYVEDVEATALYGRAGRMRAQFIDFSNTSDPAELLRLTWNALQLVNKPKIIIKATVADLEKIWGYKHEAVRMNDWGLVIADSTNVQIETVVVDIKRNYINPQLTKITLGSKVVTISDIQAEYQAHTRKVEEEARRAGGAAAAASEKIDQTQQELRIEFAGAQSAIYSSLFMTAEELEIEFTNGLSDLHSQIHVTAEELKTEFQKSESRIYSSIRQTAKDLQAEFGSVDSDLYSTIHASAEALQTEFHKANSAIYSTILQTAETLETEFGNAVSDLHSSISQTAESIQTELHTAQSAIYSYVVQTASGMEAEFGNSLSGAYAYIAASAEEIKTELHTSESSIYSEISQTASGFRIEFGNALSGVYSSISSTASSLESEFHSADSSIYSKISQTKSTIETEIHSTESSLRSAIKQEADRISLVVEGTGANAKVKKAAIVAAVKDSNGYLESSIKIDADKVYIGNEKSTTVIAGKCSLSDVTADYISGKVASLTILQVNSLGASSDISASNSVVAKTLTAHNNIFINDVSVGHAVYNVRISGPVDNVYTLQKQTIVGSGWVDCGTFSRATSLSGLWSGRNYTVTATPQGDTKTGIVYDGLVPTGSVTKNGKNVKKTFIVYSDDGNGDADSIIMQKEVSIDASSVYTDGWDAARAKVVPPSAGTDTSFAVKVPSATEGEQQTYTFTIQKGQTPGSSGYASVALSGTVVGRIAIGDWYTAGYNDGKPASGTAGGRTSGVSALVHDFTITKGDGTTATLQINVSNIYATARNGYTYGTFTPATVTTQGTAHADITPIGTEYHYTYTHLYKAGSSNTYYQAGSSYTYYEYGGTYSGYKGNGGYIVGRGSSVSVTPCGNAVRFKRHTKSETPTGTWYTINSTDYDLTYYVGGSSTTYYKGDGTSGYLRGDSMSGYKQGDSVTVTVQGSAVTVTEQGSTQYAYVSDSDGSVVRYAAGTKVTGLYNAGTEVSGTYYTKS